MARLFITPREIDLIADIAKEITKDVIGQKIYYYKVREDVSEVHEIYEESLEKTFDPPIEVDARVEWGPAEAVTDRFGYEKIYTIQVYLHYRDMIDRNILVQVGDYCSFGDNFYEITSTKYDNMIFGQVEHISGITLACKQARKGQINKKPHGPTEEIYTDSDAVQETFTQQRGFSDNAEGKTGDIRQLRSDGIISEPVSGPKQVKKTGQKSSFYGDE